jgi:hypothetical protein
MRFTNKTGLPEPIVNAITADNYSKGDSNRSVTTLIDSPRVRILRKENENTLVEDVCDRVWSVLGTAVHNIFEAATPSGHIAEERLYHEVDGWVISGAIDLQKLEGDTSFTLTDYKCTSVWAVIYGKIEWVEQLNAYAWLVRQARKTTVGKLQIVTVLRDWSTRDANNKGSSYPQAPLVIIPVPVWSDAEQDAYMEERIRIHSDAEFERLTGGDLPLCTDKERWAKPSKYAVKKTANVRALRVFDTMDAAQKYFKEKDLDEKHSIEVRKGEYSRCIGNYCLVAGVCDQFQSELAAAQEESQSDASA